MDTLELIDFLNDSNTNWEFCSNEDVEVPFDTTPEEYMKFSENDLNEQDKINLINALSNSKRALDCQIETLLYSFCLKRYAKKNDLNIPKKIELLNSIGILAPRILTKINKTRNIMEHEFYCPTKEEAEDFADIIMLFIYYTNMYLKGVKCSLEIENYGNYNTKFAKPYFNREDQNIEFTILTKPDYIEKTVKVIDYRDENYVELIKAYIRVIKMN